MKFKIDINLDDQEEVETFIKEHGTKTSRVLAKDLGFYGDGSATAAQALKNYAWNKKAMFCAANEGKMDGVMEYERICDQIYSEDIQPNIECW